jgi:hypothetical protein
MRKNFYQTHKLLRLLAILLLLQIPKLTQAQCDVTTGLIHEYQFNSSLQDNIGNNHATGALGASTMQYTTDQAGNSNSALQIIAGSGAQLTLSNPVPSADSITICFWFKADFPPNGYTARGVASDSLGNGIGYFGDSWITGNIAPSFGANFTLTGDNFSAINSLPVGTWTHVAIVKANGNTFVYYNGIIKLGIVNNANANTIIQYLFGQNNTFNRSPIGTVDNYRIYNRALGSAELVQLYNAIPLYITSQPQGQFACVNNTSNIALTVGHTQTAASYQWYQNGNAIANSNNNTLTLNNVSNADSGSYTVRIISTCNDTVISNPALVRIGLASLPTITNLNYFQTFNGTGGNFFGNIGSPTTNNANLYTDLHGGGAVAVLNTNGGFAINPQWTDTISSVSFWYRPFINNYSGSPFYLFGVPALGTSTVAGFTPLAIGTGLQLGHVGTGSAFTSSGVALTFNQWHHIAINIVGRKYTVYLNGNYAYTVTLPYNTIDAPLAFIGNTGAGTSAFTKGALGVYNDLLLTTDTLSQESLLAINDEIKFTTINYQPCDSNYGYRLSVKATSASAPLSYKWYKNNVALVNNGHTSGVDSDTLLFDRFIYANDTGVYKCEISNGCAMTTYTYNIVATVGGAWQVNAPYISITPNTDACTGITTAIAFDTVQQAPALINIQQIKYNGSFVAISNPLNIPPTAFGTYEFIAISSAAGCVGTTTFSYTGNVVNTIFNELSTKDCSDGTFGSAIEEVHTYDCDSTSVDTNYHYYRDINNKGIVAAVNTFGQINPITSVVMYNEAPTTPVILANNNLTDFNANYMHKSWAINTNSNISLSAPVNVRLYYTQADLDAMKLAINCPACTEADLVVSKHDLGAAVHDCDGDNSNFNINASIYWNKDSNNTNNEYAVIGNYAGNTSPSANGNLPLGIVGGSVHGTEFGAKYFEVTVEGFSEFRLHLIPLPNVVSIPCVNTIYPTNNTVNINLSTDSLVWNSTPNATSYNIDIKENGNTVLLANTTDTMLSLAQFIGNNGLFQFNKTYTWTIIPTDGFNYANGCNAATFSTTLPPTYCVPSLVSPFDPIGFENFRIKGEQNTKHEFNFQLNGGYRDSSASYNIPVFEFGKSYFFSTYCSGNRELYVYIDGNNDGVFSANELLIDSLHYRFTQGCNITIPNTANFSAGFRRVRVICQIQSSNNNVFPTPYVSNACNLGESVVYDFSCELKPFATPYSISNYTPDPNSYQWDDNSMRTTMGTSSNTGSFVSFVDSNNHIFARLYPLSNTYFGNVTATYNRETNDAIRNSGGRYIGSRTIQIEVQQQPISNYRLRYYLPANELDSLIANSNGVINSINDIEIMKDNTRDGLLWDSVANTYILPSLPLSNATYHTISTITPMANGDYFLDINGLNSFSSFYIVNKSSAPLNIHDIKLVGKVLTGNHALTIEDINNLKKASSAILQVSTNGKEFNDVLEIDLSKNQFSTIQNGNIEKSYRVKVTQNGNITYSNIVVLQGENFSSVLKAFPVPVKDVLHANYILIKAMPIEYQLVDAFGKVHENGITNGVAGSNHLELNLEHLAASTYTLIIKACNIILQTKVIKQ